MLIPIKIYNSSTVQAVPLIVSDATNSTYLSSGYAAWDRATDLSTVYTWNVWVDVQKVVVPVPEPSAALFSMAATLVPLAAKRRRESQQRLANTTRVPVENGSTLLRKGSEDYL